MNKSAANLRFMPVLIRVFTYSIAMSSTPAIRRKTSPATTAPRMIATRGFANQVRDGWPSHAGIGFPLRPLSINTFKGHGSNKPKPACANSRNTVTTMIHLYARTYGNKRA